MFIKVLYRKNKNQTRREYIQIVESVRSPSKKTPTHKVIATIGRVDQISAAQFDSLIQGLSKYATHKKVIDLEKDLSFQQSIKLGPRLIVQHIWKKLGLDRILAPLGLPQSTLEVIFQMVLARMDRPLSKRASVKQLHWYLRSDEYQWSLSTFYRTLDRIHPHIKSIENQLFASQYGQCDQDDFFDPIGMDLIFFDTTSVSLHTDVEGLYERGHSKDRKPDLPQFIVGLLMSSSGRPLCHYVFPGKTADIVAFKEVYKQVKQRFPIKRVILLADRGCVSLDFVAQLRSDGLEYIVGARMRSEKWIEQHVIDAELVYHRYDDNLSYSEVQGEHERYVVVLNAAQARRDAAKREEILTKLRAKEGKSLKGMVRNRGYKKFIESTGAVQIDDAKVVRDAKFDGKWVLRSNVRDMCGVDLFESYKTLSLVEDWFNHLKSDFRVAPVYLWTKERVESHVFVCFLGLLIWFEFTDRLQQMYPGISPGDVWTDIDRLKGAEITVGSERYFLRTDLEGDCLKGFRALGVGIPKRLEQIVEVVSP